MPPHLGDLTLYKEELLEKKLGKYRNKAMGKKAKFWEALARHFLDKHQVEKTDLLIDIFFQVCL